MLSDIVINMMCKRVKMLCTMNLLQKRASPACSYDQYVSSYIVPFSLCIIRNTLSKSIEL